MASRLHASQQKGAPVPLPKFIVLFGLLGASALPVAAGGQQERSAPPLVISSMYGRDLYQFYCATCHGRDGKGAGPAAVSLKIPPPDLTRLGRRNGGAFSQAAVEQFITGQERMPSAHGSSDMPVWGPIFKSLDPSDARTRVRIANIVSYLESIQQSE